MERIKTLETRDLNKSVQADWQEVWHSPQPPFFTVFCSFLVFKVFTCFMVKSLLFLSILLGRGVPG